MIDSTGKLAHSFALPLAFLGALVVFPGSFPQWEFAIVLGISFWLMAWFGHAALHFCTGETALLRETLFLKACLGQFVLLVLWLLLSPAMFLLSQVAATPLLLPMVATVSVLAMVLRARNVRRSFLVSFQCDDAGRFAFSLFAAACLFKVAAYYSVRAGALGLDTHQHIYFAVDLYDAGYLKLNAGSTPWLERYPKGLHALAALWGLPGLGDHLGSSLKIMPGLQLLLAVVSFAELCGVWLKRHTVQRSITVGSWLLIAAGLAYILFRGTRFVYPVVDLNSTARLSSASVLLLPGIIGFLMLLQPSRRTAALASAALPFAGALALKFNPALATSFFAVSVPIWLATTGWAVARNPSTWSSTAKGLLGGGIIGLVLVLTDPFYMGLMASFSDGVSTWLRNSTGLMLLPRPTSMLSALPPSATPIRVIHAILDHLWLPGADFWSYLLPNSTMALSAKMMVAMRIFIGSVLGLSVLNLIFTPRQSRNALSNMAAPVLIQIALLVGVWANSVVGNAVAQVVGTATIEASVLSTYVREFSDILVLFTLPIHWILSVTLLAQLCSRFIEPPGFGRRWQSGVGLLLILLLAISLRWWPLAEAPLPESLGWWTPVNEDQLDAFQRLEEAVPENALILADATAAKLNGREEWILPIGESAAYLSIGRQRYIFNVRLGDGYAFTYSDLDSNFCHGTPEKAKKFLAHYDIRYLFAVDHAAVTREEVLGKNYCGIKYSDLGVVYPPLATGPGGMAMYRLKPIDEFGN